MRRLHLIIAGMLIAAFAHAQSTDTRVGWIVDDFNSTEFKAGWSQVSGQWSLEGEAAVSGGSSDVTALISNKYLMRTKPYTIEASIRGNGGGIVFAMEHPDRIACGHMVMVTGSSVSTGFFDIAGKYNETRAVDYVMPQEEIRLQINVDPIRRTYSILIGERDVALETMRFISGFAGPCASKRGVKFDFFQVTGDARPEPPSFYLKSNQRQLDHLSYMTLMDESIMMSNPIVGMVQKITSTGSYVNEIPVPTVNSEPRGVFVDEAKTTYIVDAGQKAVRIVNKELQLERIISSELKDPRGVAVVRGKIVILDADGIKIFEKDGTFVGTKAAGQFKDPKNLFLAGDQLLVTDFAAGEVAVLNTADYTVAFTIKDQLVHPFDACVDEATKDIYVADPGANLVIHYDAKGTFLDRIDPMTINGFISPRAVRVRGNMVYVGDFERILGFKKDALSIRPQLKID